jgi:hypothetical protein
VNRLIVRALLVVAFAGAFSGCASVDARHDLDVALSKHHVDLRWGRIGNASAYVHPDLQQAFVLDWDRRFKKSELKDVEVIGVNVLEDDTLAEVSVRFVILDVDTQSLKEVITFERWRRQEDGRWVAVKVADLEHGRVVPPGSMM